ncbi:MAG: 3-coathanger stack domain-containing protein [Flavobacteriales bacterium]
MVRLHNAYTEGAYAGATSYTVDGIDYENPHFHAGIDGDDDIDYNTNFSGLDQTRGTVYSATWLSKWDNEQGASQQSLYDLIMKLYFHDLYSQGVSALGQYTSSVAVPYGLAQLVSEQWERECFSLELQNRTLGYDQDFAAKDMLVIAPGNGPGRSFADPETFDPVFDIESGATCNMKAGSAIHWEPGFHAAHGSTVHAYIDPAGCEMEYKVRAGLGASISAEQGELVHPVPDSKRQAVKRPKCVLAPNPTDASSMVRVSLGAMVGDGNIDLYDVSGRCIYSSPVFARDQSEFILPLYSLALAPGSYMVVQKESGMIVATSLLMVK